MGHGPELKPTKYHSIHEIPDELVQTWSKRDPDNPIYRTRRYVNMKKKQILFTQRDGVPMYLRTPVMRYFYYATWIGHFAVLATNIYYFNNKPVKKN